MKKHIVLCADDYGQGSAISQGILALVKLGRLSAVSCMVTTPHWPEHASWLIPFRNQVDIGLHFNLTEDKHSLFTLMLKSAFRRLNEAAIIAELNIQIDSFVRVMGVLPDFIDGHQHVHQFPIIRDALLTVYHQRFPTKMTYIRHISDERFFFYDTKKLVIRAMGAQALKTRLQAYQIPHNTSFSGMYNFKYAHKYSRLFPSFLSASTHRGLIMCHPGLPSISSRTDIIALARGREYTYFASDQYSLDLLAQNAVVARFIPK